MSEEQEPERQRAAYRRAGYAVTLYIQGQRLPDLFLDREPAPNVPAADDTPRWWETALGSKARHRTELDIISRWASLAAESRACFDYREPPGGWGEALAPLTTLGQRVTRGVEENDAYLEWLRRRASGLINLPDIWPAVEAVARALLAEGELASRRVTEIINGVSRSQRRRSGLITFFNPK